MAILKRNDQEKIIECLYDSSNVLASKYDKQSKELYVTFNRGAQYKYENVSLTDYTRFEMADSQGSILNSHIKKYTFSRMLDVNAEALINEIKLYKPKEMTTEEKILVLAMEHFLSINKTKGEINMDELKVVEDAINTLKITKHTNIKQNEADKTIV
jgi:hypothetical protein